MRIIKILTTDDNKHKAYITEYKVLGKRTGKYCTTFEYCGDADLSVRGVDGLGMKIYDNLRKATDAGIYYIRKNENN